MLEHINNTQLYLILGPTAVATNASACDDQHGLPVYPSISLPPTGWAHLLCFSQNNTLSFQTALCP